MPAFFIHLHSVSITIMRYFKFLFLVAVSVLAPLCSNAQRNNRAFQESVILNTKFPIGMVWDVQRFPVNPIEGREWRLTRLKAPYDVDSKLEINWGYYNDRYLMFDIHEERSNRPGSLYDEKTRRRYSVSLNLFEADGRFVKRISRWGNLIGLGRDGFVYEQEGRFGTFFSAFEQFEGDAVVYRPQLVKATHLSDIVNVDREDFNNLKLTTKVYREEGSRYLKHVINRDYRGKYEVADWNDLKALRNIEKWISYRRLKGGQTFMVTKGGKYTYGADRQYFVLYAPNGRVPSGFLVHDRISNKLFLGSWFGEPRHVLIKERMR